MTEDEQKNSKRTASKKFSWSKAQSVAEDVSLIVLSAFLTGVSMAAGQRVVNHYADRRSSSEKNVFSIVKDRSAV